MTEPIPYTDTDEFLDDAYDSLVDTEDAEESAELARLAELETVIDRGLTSFREVGEALTEVRDSGLYRHGHGTFEEYCAERWQLSRPRVYQLIDAVSVVSTMVDTGLPAPTNERQARELARVPESQRAEVWEETLARTEGKPTAAAIRETYSPPAPAPQPEPVASTDADLLDGQDWAPANTSPAPVAEPAPPRKPPVNVVRTVIGALADIDRGRRSLDRIDTNRLTQQDAETRRMWAAGLDEHLDALHRVLASLKADS